MHAPDIAARAERLIAGVGLSDHNRLFGPEEKSPPRVTASSYRIG